jgi:hypothetical protein
MTGWNFQFPDIRPLEAATVTLGGLRARAIVCCLATALRLGFCASTVPAIIINRPKWRQIVTHLVYKAKERAFTSRYLLPVKILEKEAMMLLLLFFRQSGRDHLIYRSYLGTIIITSIYIASSTYSRLFALVTDLLANYMVILSRDN